MNVLVSTKANTWKTHLRQHPQRDATNKALPAIYRIARCIREDPPIIFSRFTKEDCVAIMSVAPNKKTLQLFHHASIIGGSVVKPTVLYTALSGFDSAATPIEIEIPENFQGIDVRTPSWANLKEACSDIEQFKALEEDDENFRHVNVIGIPPVLIDAFLASPEKDPASIALAFMAAMIAHDADLEAARNEQENADQNAEKFQESFRHVIQFCWLAHEENVDPIRYMISQDNDVLEWSRQLHELHIQQPITGHPSAQHVVSLQDEKDQQTIYTLMSLKQSIDSDRSARLEKDETKNKVGFKNFAEHIQQMIRNASATSPFEHPSDEPTDFYTKFTSEKTVSKAKILLQHRLRKEKCPFDPSQGLVTALHLGQLIWDSPDFPSNFTVFLCERALPKGFNSNQSKQLHIKSTEGLGLTEADISKVTKQVLRIPKTYFDALSMLQNFYALINLFLGPNSSLAEAVSSCVKHMIEHGVIYEARQHDDPTFLTQVLFAIDSRVQLHLASCEEHPNREDVDDQVIDFASGHRDIRLGSFFHALPDCLKLKATEQVQKDTNKRSNANTGGRNGQDSQEKRIKNEKLNQKWKLRDNEPFHDVFNKNCRHAPKDNGKAICLKWFVKGFCEKSCPRQHELSAGSEQLLDKFVQVCRHNHANPSNLQDF